QFLRVRGAGRARIVSWVVVRVAGRARWGSTTVWVRWFSRCGRRWAARLVAAATASGFCVLTTTDDQAVAVVVSGERPDQRDYARSDHPRRNGANLGGGDQHGHRWPLVLDAHVLRAFDPIGAVACPLDSARIATVTPGRQRPLRDPGQNPVP